MLLIKTLNAQQFSIKRGSFIPINFNSEQTSNFKFLDTILVGNETVLLGEGLHRYDDDTRTKLQIIKYLHEELGYNLILLEFSFYDFWDMNNALGATTGIDDTLNKYCNFRFSQGIYEIIKYVNDCKKIGDTIDIGGLDIWITYNNEYRHFLKFITENQKYINEQYSGLLNSSNDKKPELNTIINLPDTILYNLFIRDELNILWKQIYDNFKIAYIYDEDFREYNESKRSAKTSDILAISDDFQKRDSMMFSNYLFLSNKFNTKSIVLTSSFHVRKGVEPFLSNPEIGNKTIPFGNYFERFSIKSYHIATVSYKVQIFKRRNIFKKYYRRDKNSLEKYLYKNYDHDGFIELKNIEDTKKSSFILYPIWRFETNGNWKKAFDAIIYLQKIDIPRNRSFFV